MLKLIIEKEIREIVGSTKFAATFGVCALLIISAFYVGAIRYEVNQSYYEASKVKNLQQLDGKTDWFNVNDFRIFLPPEPLATLVSGISNDIGRTINMSGRGELTAEDTRYNEDPIFAAFRFLDLEFIFQIVLSLFAILLGYDAISGEKERGTLKLTFANSIPRHIYLVGKVVGSTAVLGTSLLIAIGIGCLLLPLKGIPLSGDDWTRLALITLTGLLYFGAFLTLSIFVSSMTHRSASSFMTLLMIWIACVMIIPRASVALAARSVDVPAVDELASKKSRYLAELWEESRTAMENFAPTKSEDLDAVMAEFNKMMGDLADNREGKMAELATRLNENRFNRQVEQSRLAFALARISPTASMTLAATALAGTSLELKNQFNSEATSYQKAFSQFIEDKTGMNLGGRMIIMKSTSGEDEELELIDPNEMPVFEYHKVSLKASLAGAVFDLGILGLFNIIFFAGAFVAFLRYDVR